MRLAILLNTFMTSWKMELERTNCTLYYTRQILGGLLEYCIYFLSYKCWKSDCWVDGSTIGNGNKKINRNFNIMWEIICLLIPTLINNNNSFFNIRRNFVYHFLLNLPRIFSKMTTKVGKKWSPDEFCHLIEDSRTIYDLFFFNI